MKKQIILLICLIVVILYASSLTIVEAKRRNPSSKLDKLVNAIVKVIEKTRLDDELLSDSYILPSIAVADVAKGLVGRCINVIKGSTSNGKPCYRTPFEFAIEAYKLVGKSNLPTDIDGYFSYSYSNINKVSRMGNFNYGDILVTDSGKVVGIYVGGDKVVYAVDGHLSGQRKVEINTVQSFVSKYGIPYSFEVL